MLRKMFATINAEIEGKYIDLLTPQHPQVPDLIMFENIRIRYISQMCIQRAIATINQLGSKQGIERLKEVDPEIAKQL